MGPDASIRFPVWRRMRKNPKLVRVAFAGSLVITTTALVNIFLFSKGCDLLSRDASNTVSGGSVVYQPSNPRQIGDDFFVPNQREPVRLISGEPTQSDIGAEFLFDRVKGRITFPKPISRSVIGRIAEDLKLKKGFEVGVRQGEFSKEMLRQWNTCQSYHLVDLWSNPDNYLGGDNLQTTQEQNMRDAFENTNAWKEKISHCRNFSTVCATRVEDESFDFGYIDARHDFKSVYEDLEYWYPKIRTGGVLSGHDYMTAVEVRLSDGIDWSYNADKSKDHSLQAVKGAVNIFFAAHGQYVEVCSPIPSFSSWVVYKSAAGMNQANDLLHFIDFKCFDEHKCDWISDKFAYTVRAWESLNPRFLVLVWTAETISWFLKEDVEKFKSTYKNDAKAYEDMLKLKLIHKFGGTYIHESITPLQGLQSYVDQVRESGNGPAGFCEEAADRGIGGFAHGCKKVSRLLISGKKEDGKIWELANRHEREFMGGMRSGEESMKVSDRILSADKFNVFKSTTGFPCNSFTLSSGCVAQVSY